MNGRSADLGSWGLRATSPFTFQVAKLPWEPKGTLLENHGKPHPWKLGKRHGLRKRKRKRAPSSSSGSEKLPPLTQRPDKNGRVWPVPALPASCSRHSRQRLQGWRGRPLTISLDRVSHESCSIGLTPSWRVYVHTDPKQGIPRFRSTWIPVKSSTRSVDSHRQTSARLCEDLSRFLTKEEGCHRTAGVYVPLNFPQAQRGPPCAPALVGRPAAAGWMISNTGPRYARNGAFTPRYATLILGDLVVCLGYEGLWPTPKGPNPTGAKQ